MKPIRYATPAAFRRALEDRLMKLAREERLDVQRLRRQVAFDRLLCRLFQAPNSSWLLKGGYAMELRLAAARTTRDLDLAIRPVAGEKPAWQPQAIQRQLQTAATVDLHDHFVFLVGGATLDLEAAPCGGTRYPVEAQMGGRTFAKFHVDVSSGDVLGEPYEALHGRDWLAFAGIGAIAFPAISREEQFAEKLHAYTLPRPERLNSRVKDLVDMALLLQQGKLNRERLADSIRATFTRRETHAMPPTLPEPPETWAKPFAQLASECGIPEDIKPHFDTVRSHLNHLLAPSATTTDEAEQSREATQRPTA
jgi:hypothetical protein